MQYGLIILGLAAVLLILLFLIFKRPNKDKQAQRALDRYLSMPLSTTEIGRFYERYIGYLYEREGNEVIYNGAINGAADLGRDLIVNCDNETLIIQTKCWSKHRVIQENQIFQLFGSMAHFDLTSANPRRGIKAVFYTTAKYSEVARDVARVLGVELRTEWLNRSYPMIKCSVSVAGEKNYYLPFDPQYDKVKIEYRRGDFFAETVKEAAAKGFVRAHHRPVYRQQLPKAK